MRPRVEERFTLFSCRGSDDPLHPRGGASFQRNEAEEEPARFFGSGLAQGGQLISKKWFSAMQRNLQMSTGKCKYYVRRHSIEER